MRIAGRRPEDRAAIRQGDIAVNLVIADTNSMTYSFAVEFEVPRADPRRRARGAAGFGTEATVLWWPTRSKAARFSTRRRRPRGGLGDRQYVTVFAFSSTKP